MADGKLCYNPDIFRARNLDEARRIILTNEGPADTGECRRKETPALAAGLCRELNLRKNQLLLDHGCGIGRRRHFAGDAGDGARRCGYPGADRAVFLAFFNSDSFRPEPESRRTRHSAGLT